MILWVHGSHGNVFVKALWCTKYMVNSVGDHVIGIRAKLSYDLACLVHTNCDLLDMRKRKDWHNCLLKWLWEDMGFKQLKDVRIYAWKVNTHN